MEIKLSNLTKTFQQKNQADVVAVNAMNLTIPSGKLVGLLGPSGCGKSTTLYMISGLLAPTEGSIFFGDEEVTTVPPEQRGIGLVFQNYALYPHMSVRQNISFPLENSKELKALYPSRKERKAYIEQTVLETARIVKTEELLERKPGQLSGGQQQRVAIARALAKKPKVLLLDEPLSNLDARLRLETREEIKRIQRETQVTTVFVTHDQEEAMSISDQIVVMENGIIQQVAKPQDMYNQPANEFVARFLGNPPINVFHASIKDSKVWIGNQEVMTTDFADQSLHVAIRPESFEKAKKGLKATVTLIENIGRDKLVRVVTPDQQHALIILDSTVDVKENTEYTFGFKASGVHFFSLTGGRVT